VKGVAQRSRVSERGTEESEIADPAGRGGLARRIRQIGLVAGPVMALCCYLALPTEFADGTGKLVATTGTPEMESFILLEAFDDPTSTATDYLFWCMYTGH
jgi:hypothetical protein